MWKAARYLATMFGEKLRARSSTEHLRHLQECRFRSLLARAQSQSPFYARKLKRIDTSRVRLSDLPVLTKAEMMDHFDEFLTERSLPRAALEDFMLDPNRLGQLYQGRYALAHTSGTSGLRAIIVQNARMLELLYALQVGRGTTLSVTPMTVFRRIFHKARLAAVTIGDGFYPSASNLAYAPPALGNFLARRWLKSIDPLDKLVEELEEFQPDILLAYANVLELLAQEALGGRLRLELSQVVNLGEALPEKGRKLIKQAFQAPIIDNYCTGECPQLSLGCPQGHGRHLQADWAMLEVVDRDLRPVPDGQPGEKVLITNLINTVQPFIRYQLDDLVTMSPEPCPCSSPFPLIKEVKGRAEDMIWIKEGESFRRIHASQFARMLDDEPAVGWFQFAQKERNRFELRVVPVAHRQLDVAALQATLQKGLERQGLAKLIEFSVKVVKDLRPNPKSGKLTRIVSDVGPPEQRGQKRTREPVASHH
jgi:putative adenylate-forming enzyme